MSRLLGRRKLAYEIAGKTEGNYVVVKYTAEPATSDELDRVLNLNESVIRTKILRKLNQAFSQLNSWYSR